MLGDSGQRARVKGLHQKRAHSPNQRSEVAVHLPGFIGRQVKSAGFTIGDYGKPRRRAVGSAREQFSKLN
jgi:hypothetical protein